MSCRVLVVEDEIFVAIEIETVLEEMGHEPIGIAADRKTAFALADAAEVALVDLNLKDGPTGREIGDMLARRGVTVLFMTANPSQLGDGVPGTVGVLPKPASEAELRAAIDYVIAARDRLDAEPPQRMRLFTLPKPDLGGAAYS
ncbi:response regulator [Arsenicitalea aurantiaca]|uniref:Response regulator n=1 Tax=Arsenicitalea aurantiaca TaxID=1783274 RepID=A0A433XA10_9HYPH|nr:response regulator [Arsenicitalea aurantiaca]RUT30941.1 response regulator [Arsenicitalea aurantiaca]